MAILDPISSLSFIPCRTAPSRLFGNLAGWWTAGILWLLATQTVFCQYQPTSRDLQLKLPAGFQGELVYQVPHRQGSWVSMAHDPQGRLIVSDQYGSLYRITLDTASCHVEELDIKIGYAQGLLYAFDSLYVVAHPGQFPVRDQHGERQIIHRPAGLYRVRDTNQDDRYDMVELLRGFDGEGEHGPHAVVLSPDRNSLHICAGNHTRLPHLKRSLVPQVWGEDQVIPRLPDAGGHGVGISAPGGWVCRTDPDGREFELISVGFRNQYDIAFAPNGELFTYDADMEWDLGLPWYRPTRVCHITSGSEFGWRNGSGKWPPYYHDSLPAAIDIGPGSPTGITFGTDSHFPLEYQQSLFIADWSFGIIYRVCLENRGASFAGEFETFCTAPVLPITDMVVNPADGALYFLVGGRRTESALYRVRYVQDAADNSTAGQTTVTKSRQFPELDPLVHLRHRLEQLHIQPIPANLDIAWPYLSHPDRFIRFAARTAIELVDHRSWKQRVFAETDPQAKLEALLAIVRTGAQVEDQTQIVNSLLALPFTDLTEFQQLQLLRVLGLVLIRLPPTTDENLATIHTLSQYLPVDSEPINRELVRLLAAAEAPDIVAKTMPLIHEAGSQQQQIHYAISLHAVQVGWNRELRKQYLDWFATSAQYAGGSSFRQYLINIRFQFAERLPTDERENLAFWLQQPLEPQDPYSQLKARPVVHSWSMQDLPNLHLEDRDIENGKRMFGITQCYKCHLIDGDGGLVGPDLTNAGRRFSSRDLLEAIIDPDKEISDQYRATVFQLEDGRLISGRVANLVRNEYLIQEDLIQPGQLTRVPADEIETMKPAQKSMMPTGLLDTLTEDEILDLLAYLKSIRP